MSAKKTTKQSARKAKPTEKAAEGFTKDELAAMKERAKELKAEAQRSSNEDEARAEGEGEVMAKIAEMEGSDRVMAELFYQIVKSTAPELMPRTWYGMPAFAKDGKVLCFYQDAKKFKARYATVGFSDTAHLDDGAMWPTSFALKELTATEEAKIRKLVKKAVS